MPTSARTSAFSTIGTKLMYKNSTSYDELCAIKNFPDLGGEPEQIETTTLSNTNQTFCPGVKSVSSMSFDVNYTKSDYDRIAAMTGEKIFAIYFGDSGVDGKFYFKGELSIYVKGAGVNDVVEATITITPTTDITTTEPS